MVQQVKSLDLITYHAMNTYDRVFVGGEISASHPGHFTPRERALGSHWVGPKASPDILKTKISCSCQGLNHDSLEKEEEEGRSEKCWKRCYWSENGPAFQVQTLNKPD
jgi:hypothetical protein